MGFENLSVSSDGPVTELRLDRPERHNALTERLFTELREAIADCRHREATDCIVVTGTGEYFSVGGDRAEFESLCESSRSERKRRIAASSRQLHAFLEHVREVPVPVIAGVNGPAAGGGLGIAIACDLTFLAEGAYLTYSFDDVALSDAGTTYFLPRIVGLKRALSLVFRSSRIAPQRAVELGLANDVLPADAFHERLDEIAAEIADGPTDALGRTKRLMGRSMDRSLRDQLAAEERAVVDEVASEEFEEIIRGLRGGETDGGD